MKEHLSCGQWEQGRDIGEGVTVYMQWSRKPKEGGKKRRYRDYQEKIETYIGEVGGQAEGLKPGVLEAARQGGDPAVISSTRFAYMDTNSYRNGTRGIESRIEEEVVAVIGVGGTGSYWPARCFIPVGMRVYITADGTDLESDGWGLARL